MENLEMEKTEEETLPSMEVLETNLFREWFAHEFMQDHIAASINATTLFEMLEQSRQEDDSVDFLAVGCQQFAEVSSESGESVSIPVKMGSESNCRFGRFTNEMVSMLKALDSFGVKTRTAITFSDLECLLTKSTHEKLFEEMSLMDIFTLNNDNFTKKMSKEGLEVSVFNHSEALMHVMNVQSVKELLEGIFKDAKNNSDIEELLDRLYNSDPHNLPIAMQDILKTERNSLGLVWLDIMSPLAGDHRTRLHNAIKNEHPEMPVIVPFHNSGKWETAVEPERIFLDRLGFISRVLKISNKDKSNWLREALSKPDQDIQGFFNTLGLDIEVNDARSKENAVKLLEKLTFGTSNFDLIEEITPNPGETLKQLIVRRTGWKGNHVFNLLKDGNIKVNGIPANIHDMEILHHGNIISVGSLKLRIKQDE